MRTKVVATMGPAASTPEVVTDLVRAGMDIARINMSHGHHEHHRRGVELVREASRRVGRPVAILADLQGPKLRIGRLDDPVRLDDGEIVTIAPEGEHSADELPTSYTRLAEEVTGGTRLLLDDGQIELVCVNTDGERAVFRVLRGGIPAVPQGDEPSGDRCEHPGDHREGRARSGLRAGDGRGVHRPLVRAQRERCPGAQGPDQGAGLAG